MVTCRLIVGAVLVAVVARGSLAALPEDRCAALKLRGAEKRARGLVACQVQAALVGGDVDPACIETVERKFLRVWSRVESKGGCATLGDAENIATIVDAFVDDLWANLRTTTITTTTTSTSCPPPTALYCGVSGCAPLPALCPTGMSCQTAAEGCGCVGAAIPCGDASLSGLSGDFCRWGTCPPGTTCGRVAKPDACGFDCTCQ